MSAEVLEKYKQKIPKDDNEHYISRKRYETMLVGCLPFEDQELYFKTLSSKSAMILTGKKGCGKRTLEEAFLEEYGEMFPALLRFPFCQLAEEGEETLEAELKDFFSALANKEAEDDEAAYMVSLGEINAVDTMPKVCSMLAHGLENTIKNGKNICIITAVYDGEVRNLPKSIRKSVLVCRVDPPSLEERLHFFESSLNSLLGFVNDVTGIDFMAEYTEGFTFDDLNDLIRNLHAFLKAKFVTDVAETSGGEIGEVEMADIGIDKVNLEKDDFIYLADNYKVEKPQPAGAFDMSALTEVLSNLTLNLASGAEEKKPEENSPFALLDDDDDPDNIF